MIKKIRIIEAKGARQLVLLRRDDFTWLVELAKQQGEVAVLAVGGQLQTIGCDESYLLEEQKL